MIMLRCNNPIRLSFMNIRWIICLGAVWPWKCVDGKELKDWKGICVHGKELLVTDLVKLRLRFDRRPWVQHDENSGQQHGRHRQHRDPGALSHSSETWLFRVKQICLLWINKARAKDKIRAKASVFGAIFFWRVFFKKEKKGQKYLGDLGGTGR